MADSHRYVLNAQLDIEQILQEAKHRWLRPAEILAILQNHSNFRISSESPNRPPSGSLFLFDRKVLRYFRKDGHNWRKKKDGKTVKEAHERLKSGSIDVLHCYYAHGQDNENFQRRCYWMLEEDKSNIVFVHYREVKASDYDLTTDVNDVNITMSLSSAYPTEQIGYNIQNDYPLQASTAQGSFVKPESAVNADDKTYQSHFRQPLLDGVKSDGLRKLDSFDRWMSKELGDVTESNTQLGLGSCWDTVGSEDGVDDSGISNEVSLDNYVLGPSLSQDQLFTILDFSPNWAYSGSEIKVLITGRFLRTQSEVEKHNWACMFGKLEVPAEIVGNGVIRCHTPLLEAGRVPFYITCSNRLACSEVREFEFRPFAIQDEDLTDVGSLGSDEMLLHMRFGKLLTLKPGENVNPETFDQGNASETSRICNKVDALLKDDSEWKQMLNLSRQDDFSADKVKDQLLQKLLKEKLHAWLIQKVNEGGKGASVLDEGGQGVLHFAGALGYDWAIPPTIAAGVSVNFRDANGWTALHWAAYYGRERTVAFLISLDAAPGALTDPTPRYPSRTPAALASSNGHKGISGYLSEYELTFQLLTLDLKKDSNETDARNKSVQTVSERTATPLRDGDMAQGLSMKDSLAAVRNATQAAARIHQVFRVGAGQRKQMKEFGDSEFGISDERALSLIAGKSNRAGKRNVPVHAAAVRIQNKFRSWKGRKDFLLTRQRIIKIQAHVRGHQVRKNYKKIIWSVGILDKVILRWRRRGRGLSGFKPEGSSAGTSSSMPDNTNYTKTNEDDYDFLKEGRKQTEERLNKALSRGKSMVQYPEARDQYCRLLNDVSEMQKTKALHDKVLNDTEIDFDDDLIDLEALLADDTFMDITYPAASPGIEGFQIIGEAKPGGKLLACGYPVRGTSLCMFQWVRHYPDGTKHYIEGATNPDYILTDEDVDKLIAVECTPMDEQGRQGEIVRIFANDHKKIKCASFVLPHETWRSELENDYYEQVSFTSTDVPFDSISESSTLKIHDVKSSLAETIEVMTQEVKGTEFTKRESKMLDHFDSDALAKEESESISEFHEAEPESLNLTYGREIESTSPMESEFASSIYDTLSSIHHEITTLHDKNITITISATGKLHEYADLELIILHDSLIELQHANQDIGNLDLNHYRKNNYYLFLVKKKQLPVDQQSIAVSNQSLASLLGCQLSSVLPPHFLIYERFATEKEWSQACVVILTEIDHLVNSLTNGPYHCPDLAVLFLQGENTLSYISSSFFNFMPVLRFLDLSGTRSRTLPSSLFTLTQLQVLLLRNCPRLVTIPTEIENLRHVQVLDVSGTTELHYLPVQVGKLTNLKEFQVSLYGPDNESEHAYLPPELLCRGILSKLQELEALSIAVHPEDHRWRKMASDITQEIIELKNLRHLQFYFPEIENLETFIKKSPSWNTLRTFKLVVGHDVKRIAPRVPDEVVFKYDQLARCVRFVNGDCGDLPQVIKKVVACATAFCLDHHLKVHSLSQFGIYNLKELKFCVVRECPNFKVFAGYEKKNIEAIMPSLEFLEIHYLWKLQRIWSSVNMAKGSFNALKHLTVYTCPRLKFILPASILPCLISLEELVVADCEAVTRITKGKVKNDVRNNTTTLPNLRKVELHNLLRLVSLGNGICATRAEIVAVGCPSFNQNVKPAYSRPSLCC